MPQPDIAMHNQKKHYGHAPLQLADWGSFYIHGETREVSDRPARSLQRWAGAPTMAFEENGTYMVGQAYVQYLIPGGEPPRLPVIMLHGGGMTAACWETTPDGREGWAHWFLRRGHPVYLPDQVGRGRSGWFPYDEYWPDRPYAYPMEVPLRQFRLESAASGAAREGGTQFPLDRYEDFACQLVPSWPIRDESALSAFRALLQRVGPCIVLCHSQSGYFGFRLAQALPHLVRALVAIEPGNCGEPSRYEAMRQVPTLVVYGDCIDERTRHLAQLATQAIQALRCHGGRADLVDLPSHGIRGNTHMMMMDKNSDQIAGLISAWLATLEDAGHD